MTRRQRWFVIAAVIVGAIVSALAMATDIGPTAKPGIGPIRAVVVAALVALALAPPLRMRLARLLARHRDLSPRVRLTTAAALAIAAGAYLVGSTLWNGRDLLPKSHDENSYALQVTMLAHGRLWMPSHPLADFFDAFQMLSTPVYASIYFPGAALMYVPGAWLALPVWVAPLVVSGIAVALTYLLGAQLLDETAGVLAALLLLGVQWFRLNATLVMSQVPMMALGAAMLLAWLRWRRDPSPRWALVLGAVTGWAAITRPVDALAYAIPIGAVMLWETGPLLSRSFLTSALLIILAAAPFLGLQLLLDRGTTGHWLKTPHTLYLERDQPLTTYGFHEMQPGVKPVSTLPQKQIYYSGFMVPAVEKHRVSNLPALTWERLAITLCLALPTGLVGALVFAGYFGIRGDTRLVVLAAVPILFLLLYLPYTFYLWHYVIAIAPPLIILMVLGARALAASITSRADRAVMAQVGAHALLVAIALTSLPELNRGIRDDMLFSVDNSLLRIAIAQHVKAPAVVLVRYAKGSIVHDEPVYNYDVVWPDDAPVIHAHDLGPRNAEIVDYYARTQPDREFFRFDRGTYRLQHLGTAAQLAQVLAARAATTAQTPTPQQPTSNPSP